MGRPRKFQKSTDILSNPQEFLGSSRNRWMFPEIPRTPQNPGNFWKSLETTSTFQDVLGISWRFQKPHGLCRESSKPPEVSGNHMSPMCFPLQFQKSPAISIIILTFLGNPGNCWGFPQTSRDLPQILKSCCAFLWNPEILLRTCLDSMDLRNVWTSMEIYGFYSSHGDYYRS